jgi:polyribonucleotide nucleotidyltransferase
LENYRITIPLEDKEIILETGELAKQADGAILVRCGKTVLLVTAVESKTEKGGKDFFPLLVDIEEKMYAVGEIPGGFIKREGRPSDESILTARLIDRPIRPLFPDDYRSEVQIIGTILSVDKINPFDNLGILGASAALTISDIPFLGPIGAVRVGYINDKYVINPTYQQLEESSLDLVVAGTKESITMMGAKANEVSEEVLIGAIEAAKQIINLQIDKQIEFSKQVNLMKDKVIDIAKESLVEAVKIEDEKIRQSEISKINKESISKTIELAAEELKEDWKNKTPYMELSLRKLEKELTEEFLYSKLVEMIKEQIQNAFLINDVEERKETITELKDETIEEINNNWPEYQTLTAKLIKKIENETAEEFLTEKLLNIVREPMLKIFLIKDIEERKEMINQLKEKAVTQLGKGWERYSGIINNIHSNLEKELVRKRILEDGIRPDNRKATDIREISCKAGYLPRDIVHGSGLFTRGQTQVLTILTLGELEEKQMLNGLTVEESKRYMHHYNFPPFCTGETGFLRGPRRREIGHGALAEKALLPFIPDEDEFPYTLRLVSEVLQSNGSTSMASVCASTLALMDAGVPIKKAVAGIALGLVKKDDKVVILSDILGEEDHYGDMDFKVAGTKDGITAIQMDIKITGITTQIITDVLKQAEKDRLFILSKILDEISEPRSELSPNAPRVIKMEISPDKIGDIIGTGGKVIKSIIDETGVDIDIEEDGKVYIYSTDSESSKRAIEMIEDIIKKYETTMYIPTNKIGEVIGTGGSTIKNIQEKTNSKINVEDNGKLHIQSSSEENLLKAKKKIQDIVQEVKHASINDVKTGQEYIGTVINTTSFGAFVEILPGVEGLLHISKLSYGRVDRVEDVVKVGDKIKVIVIGKDFTGKINLDSPELRKKTREH